jgi:hypothetical protein
VCDYDGWQTTAWKLQAAGCRPISGASTWKPADVVETIEALQNEVTLNQVSASTDWPFAPRWRHAGAALLRSTTTTSVRA